MSFLWCHLVQRLMKYVYLKENLIVYSTFTLTTGNTLRVLQRVASIFSRNRVNIKQLYVQETLCQTMASFSIKISANPQITQRVEKQLARIIEIKTITITPEENNITLRPISEPIAS